jgi:hypothetical protein
VHVVPEPFQSPPLALLAEHVEAELLEPVAGVQPRTTPTRRAVYESVTLIGIAGSHSRTLPNLGPRESKLARGLVDFKTN